MKSYCLLYNVLLNLHIFPALNKHCTEPYLGPLLYIYIHTRFQKGFHIERYIDRYILLFSCTCARVHFSFAIVQLVKKSRFNDKFFLRRVVCSNLKRTCRLCMCLRYKFCNGKLYSWFWVWRKTSHEAADPWVIRRHRIGRLNAMASVASDEAFLLM